MPKRLIVADINFMCETLDNRLSKPHLTCSCERLVRYRATRIAVPKNNIVQLCMLALDGAYGGLSESGWWILVPALVGRTATSETYPSLPELPNPATMLPFTGKLVSLASAVVLFDSHLHVD
jgi:hypothetical protein